MSRQSGNLEWQFLSEQEEWQEWQEWQENADESSRRKGEQPPASTKWGDRNRFAAAGNCLLITVAGLFSSPRTSIGRAS